MMRWCDWSGTRIHHDPSMSYPSQPLGFYNHTLGSFWLQASQVDGQLMCPGAQKAFKILKICENVPSRGSWQKLPGSTHGLWNLADAHLERSSDLTTRLCGFIPLAIWRGKIDVFYAWESGIPYVSQCSNKPATSCNHEIGEMDIYHLSMCKGLWSQSASGEAFFLWAV
jgi:hypothetical protein